MLKIVELYHYGHRQLHQRIQSAIIWEIRLSQLSGLINLRSNIKIKPNGQPNNSQIQKQKLASEKNFRRSKYE